MVYLLFYCYYVNKNSQSKVKLQFMICKTGRPFGRPFHFSILFDYSSAARIAAPMAPAYLASGVLSTGAFNASSKRSRT